MFMNREKYKIRLINNFVGQFIWMHYKRLTLLFTRITYQKPLKENLQFIIQTNIYTKYKGVLHWLID